MHDLTAPPSVDGSKEKLLASAERLFADRGFNGVSVRDIASQAGVNSALVAYYFGNKRGLLSAVYLRHCQPLNQERLRLLREFSRADGGATLEQVLEAFLRPALAVSPGGDGSCEFTRLRAILCGENSELLEEIIEENFDRPSQLFIEAFARCLPQLRRDDLLWRFHFLLGTLYHTGSHARRLQALSEGKCNPSNTEDCLKQLIPFLVAGFRLPSI
jgi:AcrR family transcriptional regulator